MTKDKLQLPAINAITWDKSSLLSGGDGTYGGNGLERSGCLFQLFD